MRIFISEYVCSGAWPGNVIVPTSLLAEGQAMLTALLQDVAQCEAWQCVTTWDGRLGPASTLRGMLGCDAVDIVEVAGPAEEAEVFARLCDQCDASYVIAPEVEDILADRCVTARSHKARCLNHSQELIALAADKWATYEWCRSHDVPTIPTQRIGPKTRLSNTATGAVIKPRKGAGCLAIDVRHGSSDDNSYRDFPLDGSFLLQPRMNGRALSVAAIMHDADSLDVLPIAEQRLRVDHTIEYLGGEVPAILTDSQQGEITESVRRWCRQLPASRGYLGFDLLLTDDPPQVLLVEINPRLTTSYLGYRAMCRDNLAKRMFEDRNVERPLMWKPGRVRFDSDGQVRASDGRG